MKSEELLNIRHPASLARSIINEHMHSRRVEYCDSLAWITDIGTGCNLNTSVLFKNVVFYNYLKATFYIKQYRQYKADCTTD